MVSRIYWYKVILSYILRLSIVNGVLQMGQQTKHCVETATSNIPKHVDNQNCGSQYINSSISWQDITILYCKLHICHFWMNRIVCNNTMQKYSMTKMQLYIHFSITAMLLFSFGSNSNNTFNYLLPHDIQVWSNKLTVT